MAALALFLLALVASPALAQDSLPELTAPVNDFANVIDPASAADIDRMSRALQSATGDAVVVATLPTVGLTPFASSRSGCSTTTGAASARRARTTAS
jgi:uncharacterized protein